MQQLPQFTVSDPNQVPEVFVNGPINLQFGPEVCTVVFTNARPDIDKLMHGKPETNAKAVVVVRLIMPTSVVSQLHTMLGQGLNSLALHPIAAAGPDGGTVTPSGKGH